MTDEPKKVSSLASALACTDDDITSTREWLQMQGLKSLNTIHLGRLCFSAEIIIAAQIRIAELEKENFDLAARQCLHNCPQAEITTCDEVIYTRDLDGTGSQHVCSYNDPGAIAWHRSKEVVPATVTKVPEMPSTDAIIDLIGELGRAAFYLLDDCETSGPVGNETHTITDDGLKRLSDVLDRIEALPFEEPGCILGPGAKLQEALEQMFIPRKSS